MDPGNYREESDQKWWQLRTKVRMSKYDSQVNWSQQLRDYACLSICIEKAVIRFCRALFFEQLLFKILACCVHSSSFPHIWKDARHL